jgi:hypothetical protein
VTLARRVSGGAADLGGWAGTQAGKARTWASTAADAAGRAARRESRPADDSPTGGPDTNNPPT